MDNETCQPGGYEWPIPLPPCQTGTYPGNIAPVYKNGSFALDQNCCQCNVSELHLETIIAVMGALVVVYLIHMYVHAGAHSAEDVDEGHRLTFMAKNMAETFGLEEEMDAFDQLDFDFLRISHVLSFTKIYFVSKLYDVLRDGVHLLLDIGSEGTSKCARGFPVLARQTLTCNGLSSESLAHGLLWIYFILWNVFLASNIAVHMFLPHIRQLYWRMMPCSLRYDRQRNQVIRTCAPSMCCRGGHYEKTQSEKENTFRLQKSRVLKVVLLTYFTLYPFALDMAMDGFACTRPIKDTKFKVSVLDYATKCEETEPVTILMTVFWLVPPLFYLCSIVKHAYMKTLDSVEFLHSRWGFSAIGLKPRFVWWPLLEVVEIITYLILYADELNAKDDDDKMLIYIKNLAIVSVRLEALRFFRPYVSHRVQSLSTSYLRTLQVLNFLAIMYVFFLEEFKEKFEEYEEQDVECGNVRPYGPAVLVILHIVVTAWFFVFKGLMGQTISLCTHPRESDEKLTDFEANHIIPAEDLEIRTDVAKLGAGGAGSVYKAKWKHDPRPVAAKELIVTLMNIEDSDEFDREVKNLMNANHRAVINFYGICDKADENIGATRRYIVMEYAANGALEELLETAGKLLHTQLTVYRTDDQKDRMMQLLHPLDSRQILTWAMDIASALQYLNSKSMPHRDVKPQNIFLTDTNMAKLGDLGFAKLTRDASKSGGRQWWHTEAVASKVSYSLSRSADKGQNAVKPQPVGGTPEYMAPEAFEKSADDWGEKVDVWGFGVLLKRILSLDQPFPHGTVTRAEMAVGVASGKRWPFQHLRPGRIWYSHPMMKPLISACLQFDPNKRPSFDVISALLRRMLQNPTLSSSKNKALTRTRSHSDSSGRPFGLVSPTLASRSSNDLFLTVDNADVELSVVARKNLPKSRSRLSWTS